MRKITLTFLALWLTACVTTTLPPLPTVAPLPTFTATPVLVIPTLAPTRTPAPTATNPPPQTPTATPSCDLNLTLRELKKLITSKEYDLTYSIVIATRTLSLWIVEPTINPASDLNTNVTQAQLSAVNASTVLAQAPLPCGAALIDVLTVSVVDRNYEAWFGGTIKFADAAAKTPPATKVPFFSQGFVRSTPVVARAAAPAQTCKWVDARAKMQKQFNQTYENAGLELVVDETGVNAYAQWVGQPDATLGTKVVAFAAELRCLYPPLDNLVIILVDEAGQIVLVGQTPGKAVRASNYATEVLTQFNTLYPKR